MTAQLQTELSAAVGTDYKVTITPVGWAEITPANPIRDQLDIVRLVGNGTTWNVYHLTHNEVLRGQATFSGTLTGYAFAFARELADTVF